MNKMVFAVAAVVVASEAAPLRVMMTGGTEEFRAFVREAAGYSAVVETFGDVGELPLETADKAVFVIAPRYPKGEQTLKAFDELQMDAFERALMHGNKFYIERAVAADVRSEKFLGLRTLSDRAVQFAHRIVESDAGLIQNRAGSFLPSLKCVRGEVWAYPSILASVSDAVGVNAVFVPAEEKGPLVAVSHDGRRVASAMRLAPYNHLSMRPYSRWRKFYAAVFAPLLGRDAAEVEKAFAKVWPDFLSASGGCDPDATVKKALAWHEKSGILFSPDGRKGMREAVMLSGSFGWREELRTDCNLMTGALFAHAGKAYGRADWTALGRSLADNILDRGNQTEEGYFRWFDREVQSHGKNFVYATDHGRSMLAVVNLYEATGERRYLDAARRAADAFLAWQSDDGLVTICFDLRKSNRPVRGHSENPVCYYDNIPALFKIASCTGDGRYAEAALKCVRTMSAKFPDFDLGSRAFYSANSVYGRYLLIAAAAQAATDDDFSRTINGVLDFYERNQHPSGGISEIKIRLVKHDEAGVGIGDGSDHVADMLYCNNFSLAALSLLDKTPPEKAKGIDMARARRIYRRLRDFLCRVQISSPDPRVDGAWMRAYEMDMGEWYGLDRDAGWGPYCIETGWTMGTIPAVMLFDSRPGSYW
jgi:hypothetical protein